MGTKPMTVSVCVVALNEEAHLPQLLNDLYNQTYPRGQMEFVLVDSGSSDKTKQIMLDFARCHENEYMAVKLADNPRKIQAAGWNVAISNAAADVIIRIDAHTHIPADFVEKNMKLQRQGEYITGGVRPCVIENRSAWSALLLEAENSLFGSSVNVSRRGTKRQYVKTMFHAAYRREVFEKAGVFNENLLRTEDNEMHYRLRQAGFRFCFDPEIISYQYARNSLQRMAYQKYSNGRWIALTLGVCPRCISLFYFVPFAFVLGILLTGVLALCGHPLLAELMWACYGAVAVMMAVLAAIGDENRSWYCVLLPFLFLLLHLSYGVGTLVGLVEMPFWVRKIRRKG